jgi:hypothetical protein
MQQSVSTMGPIPGLGPSNRDENRRAFEAESLSDPERVFEPMSVRQATRITWSPAARDRV